MRVALGPEEGDVDVGVDEERGGGGDDEEDGDDEQVAEGDELYGRGEQEARVEAASSRHLG